MEGPNNIVLIDDDPIFNYIHSKVIETSKIDFVVRAFDKASAALAELKSAQAGKGDFRCIIFLDINMPVLNGWDFLNAFTAMPAFIVDCCEVFMLSSSNDKSDIDRSKTYSVVKGFISKPISGQQVVDISTGNYKSAS